MSKEFVYGQSKQFNYVFFKKPLSLLIRPRNADGSDGDDSLVKKIPLELPMALAIKKDKSCFFVNGNEIQLDKSFFKQVVKFYQGELKQQCKVFKLKK